jgi:hypothetical protein
MKVTIVDIPEARRYDIYVYSEGYSNLLTSLDLKEGGQWIPIEPNATPEFPTLSIDYALYEAFVREAIGTTPFADFDVIQDHRKVRDRLLSLIEKLT